MTHAAIVTSPFCYESNHCQVLGFGPSGISYSSSSDGQRALKTLNPESSAGYLQAVRAHSPVWNRFFQYQRHDLELLHLTRRLASLKIDKASFAHLFGPDAWDRYLDRFDLLIKEGLLKNCPQKNVLTPRGMFFSDSIAALLAESRWESHSDGLRVARINDNSSGHM